MIITAGWVFDLEKWAEDNNLEDEPTHEVQRDIQLALDHTVRSELGKFLQPDRADWDGTNKVVNGIVLVSWNFNTKAWSEGFDTVGLRADDVRAMIQQEVDAVVRSHYKAYVTSDETNWKALVR